MWNVVQNALKVFPDFPSELMDVVRTTNPATVTQHGLYMRDLSSLSINAQQRDAEASQAMTAQAHNSELSDFMSTLMSKYHQSCTPPPEWNSNTSVCTSSLHAILCQIR